MEELVLQTGPVVELVGRPAMEVDGLLSFLRNQGLQWPEIQRKLSVETDLADFDGEWLVELGDRMRTGVFEGGSAHNEHLQAMNKSLQGDVLENAFFSFAMYHVSRGLAHELARCRGVTFSELGQGCLRAGDGTGFVVPQGIQALRASHPDLWELWRQYIATSRTVYAELVSGFEKAFTDSSDRAVRSQKARQLASSILPNAVEGAVLIGANVRVLREAILTRAKPAVDREIRNLFVQVFDLVAKACPNLFCDMFKVSLPDGTYGVLQEGEGE